MIFIYKYLCHTGIQINNYLPRYNKHKTIISYIHYKHTDTLVAIVYGNAILIYKSSGHEGISKCSKLQIIYATTLFYYGSRYAEGRFQLHDIKAKKSPTMVS